MCCASLLETVRENSARLCRHLADWRFRPWVEGCGALIVCCRGINGPADFCDCLPAASEDVLTGGIKLVAPTKGTELFYKRESQEKTLLPRPEFFYFRSPLN